MTAPSHDSRPLVGQAVPDRAQLRLCVRHSLTYATCLTLALLIVTAASAAETRTWSSASGSYKKEAELVELKDDGTVVLKTKSGKTISVAISKLSDADQAYARSRSATKPPGEKAEAAKTPDEVEAEAMQ